MRKFAYGCTDREFGAGQPSSARANWNILETNLDSRAKTYPAGRLFVEFQFSKKPVFFKDVI